MQTLFAPLPLLVIFTGAGVGGILRHLMSGLVARGLGTAFPYGTLAVNLCGGLLIGLLVGCLAAQDTPPLLRAFLVPGLLGGFTTFSVFTLETVTLLERQQTALALAYILASVCGSILAFAGGMALARALAS